MPCTRIQPHILACIEGELRPRLHRKVAAHLASCPTCQAEVQGLQQTLHLVQTLAVPEPEPVFWETLATTLRPHLQTQPVRVLTRWLGQARDLLRVPKPVMAAVAVSLIVVGTLPWLHGQRRPPALPALGFSSGDETQIKAELDFFQYLDLLEDVEALEHLDGSL